MAQFHLQIANQTAQIHSLFDSTPAYFHAYLTQAEADFSVRVTREDLMFEQRELDAEALREGFRLRKFTDPFLERAAIQRSFAEYLFDLDTLLLHGSAVAADGQGYLFAAKSGTGKSTHTRLWCQLLGDRALMINDDKPFIHLHPQGATIFGSPWSGKHGLDANSSVPLKGICILTRGQENKISPMSPDSALSILRHECYRPLELSKESRFLELTARLSQTIPLWQMQCNRDPLAAKMSFEAMSAPQMITVKNR